MREIKDCPLVATLRNGGIFAFTHDAEITNNLFVTELTSKSIAVISTELFKKGIDIVSLSVDESRMNYAKEEEMI